MSEGAKTRSTQDHANWIERRVDNIDERLSLVESSMLEIKDDVREIRGDVGHLREDVSKVSVLLLGNGKIEESLGHRFIQVEKAFTNIKKFHWTIVGAAALAAVAAAWKIIAWFIREGVI